MIAHVRAAGFVNILKHVESEGALNFRVPALVIDESLVVVDVVKRITVAAINNVD